MLTENNTFFIPGPSGPLESLALMGNNPSQNITAVLCHPHPLFSGTMHNKVITTLAQTFRDLGINSVRFNFRGVGNSAGVYDSGEGELQDCLAVMEWVKKTEPQHAILLAGFSFGGCVALRAAAQINPIGLVTIAPAVHAANCRPAQIITCPWIIVQGESDDVTDPKLLYQWLETRPEKPLLIRMPETGHFFHGKLGQLKQHVTEAIKNIRA